MNNVSPYYTTQDLKDRYQKKATRTFQVWQEKRGMPKPVPFSQGGGNLYSKEAIHKWEEQGMAA